MSRILFRQIPKGSKLLAAGNFFKGGSPGSQWRLASFFDREGQVRTERFGLEMACVLGVGREFTGEDDTPYLSHGFRKKLVLPPVGEWKEATLGRCDRLSKRLAQKPEIAGQQCFVFEADGVTFWLPKFELARKLFFHAGFLVRAAFEPNGLDMVFSVIKEEGAYHIHTPSRTGAPVQYLKIKGYRDLFSWLLLEREMRSAFESIWMCLNQEQVRGGSQYARWQFNFLPPECLSGVTMEVRGPWDRDSGDMLVWEIQSLQGLRFEVDDDIFFHHPSLKMSVRGEGGGWSPPNREGADIEVDADEEPDEDKQRQLIELPIEGMFFNRNPATRVAYKGKQANGHGKKVDDEQVPGGGTKALGLADDVAGGTIAPGELNQLERQEEQEEYPNRFVMLREIIQQIAEEPGIELLELEVKPLPYVPRCSYHMMADDTARCYLMARFRLEDGRDRYLLEVDTSDHRKTMSTRIMSFKEGAEAGKSIDRILKDMVKASLRWPSTMVKHCEPLHSVHHPKESSFGANPARIFNWKQRIRALLS
ncbi:transposase [Zobellella denitrificans]|uniref:Tn7-like element transposition protein TnsE n=1 Tax=Zobellella denitrificans TaxID=347534 RepID=UPI000B8C0C81|nr:Tn7-like element transposition protein TnsE [Zobellella denitrificans]OXS16062.1 transposase [Zobellella denitrificans]